jgi:hypothetical protein
MKFNSFLIVGFAILSISFVSCKKDEKKPETGSGAGTVTSGTVKINLDSKWGSTNEEIVLGSEYTHALSGDQLIIETYKYYISNFRLKKSDGTWWSHPDSYFLVNQNVEGSNVLSLTGVPFGNYTDISFVMGVDSTKNVSGPQSGALSTANGMFWSWSSGYIMLKIEGTSPQITSGNVFSYHLGGFQGAYNIVKSLDYNFGSTELNVTSSNLAQVYMLINTEKLFDGVGSVTNGSTSSPGNVALNMATAFQNGISFDYLTN